MALEESPRTTTLWEAVKTNRPVRHVVTVMPAVAAVLLLVAVLLGASWADVAAGLVLGFLAATFIDYVLHRWWFHTGPHGARAERMTFKVSKRHLDHHGIPAHPKGAVNKIEPTVTMAAIFAVFALAATLIWNPLHILLVVTAGGAIGAMAQDLVHFGTHHLPMRGPLLGLLKRHHMLHHYRDDTVNFSTFFPVWDVVFGTYWDGRPRKREDGVAMP